MPVWEMMANSWVGQKPQITPQKYDFNKIA